VVGRQRRRAGVTLTVSVLDAPLTRPLLDGSAIPAGLAVTAEVAASVDANSRAMQALAFDVAEMSFATYLRARLVDGAPLTALPAFTGRRFVQPLMGTSEASPVQGVADLPGRRVAVPQYWMTSSVWHRAVLHDYYGIAASDITWVTTGRERFPLEAAGVQVDYCSDGRTPAELVLAGDADAVLAPRPPAASLRQLFADPVAEQLRYHEATGVLPIMHLVVVHQRVLDTRPDDLSTLWRALLRAREQALPGPPVPGLPADVRLRPSAADPWAYGLEVNRPSLEALVAAATREGLVVERPELPDLFVPAAVLS
jgi:4,5-dihydroxyphthalate decarboxylase